MTFDPSMLWWLLPVFALLFAAVDVWYFARVFVIFLKVAAYRTGVSRRVGKCTKEELFAPYDLEGIVLPSDLDHMMHMNNSKYLREMDFGRIGMIVDRGGFEALRLNRGSMTLTAHCVRYRRSLTLFQRFVLRTTLLCWDEDAVYMEQRMIRKSDGFVCAINLAKVAVRGALLVDMIKTWVGEGMESPSFPPEVESWRQSIAASSRNLLEERKKMNTTTANQ